MDATQIAEPSKKRKRTGKAREEAKKAAIQAKLDAEAVQPVDEEAAVDGAQAIEEENQSADVGNTEMQERGPDLEKIAGRIPQALKTLHPTFKQAKTFEIQRLVKKIKFLRSKDSAKDEVTDLEAQLALLSHIPLHAVAQDHLRLKLAKHSVFNREPLPTSITTLLTPTETPSTSHSQQVKSKVENRLCSAKAVAEAVKTVVSWTVGEDGAKLVRPVKGKPTLAGAQKRIPSKAEGKTKDAERDQIDAGEEDAVDMDAILRRMDKTAAVDGDESDDDLAIEDAAADEAGWESGSIDGGDDSGAEEDSEGSVESEAEADSESESSSVAIPTKKSKVASVAITKSSKTKAAPAASRAVTSSTFLPSLSTGFTLGDSDSDPDLDPDVDGAGIVGKKGAERKNRRGQRARQAIWEKKYGKGAKHVIKAKEAEKLKEREAKWGPLDQGWGKNGGKGGAVGAAGTGGTVGSVMSGTATGARGGRGGFAARGGAAGRGGTYGRGGISGRPSAPSESRPSLPEPKAAAGGASLHPSWEAARLRKQKEMAAAPKAQKIVFD